MATVESLRRLTDGRGLPDREPLPRYVAPLPTAVENLGLSALPLVVAVNLAGTAFGFWYYRFQFAGTPPVAWPVVPDSPTATLLAALAFGAWYLDRGNEYVAMLAFLGCWKLGLWTPYVLVAFAPEFLATTSAPMYAFLLTSHLAMVAQGFVLHRLYAFRVRAVAVAAAFYAGNDVVDYFLPVAGTPHHTLLPGQRRLPAVGGFSHPSPAHEVAAAGAVVLTVSGVFLALATRVEKAD